MKSLYFLFLCFLSLSASAQVFKIGHLFDAKDARWLKDQVIVVEDGLIKQMNPSKTPTHLPTIDLSQFWVTPAFIDAHSHLFLKDETMGKDFSQGLKKWVNQSKKTKKELGHKRAKAMSEIGFVLARDLGNQGDLTQQDLQEITEIRIVSSGAGWVPQFGQLPPKSSKELAREYRQMNGKVEFSDDLVKLYADEEPNHTFADPIILENLVKKAHAEKKMVAVHAILSQGIEVALTSGADTLEHGVEISDEQLKRMSSTSMIFVPTVSGALFLDKRSSHPAQEFRKACVNIKKARALNIPVAFGSDHYFDFSGAHFGRELIEIVNALTGCGLTNNAILQMLTYHASLTQNLVKTGLIEKGYRADLNIYEQSPEKDLKVLFDLQARVREGKKTN